MSQLSSSPAIAEGFEIEGKIAMMVDDDGVYRVKLGPWNRATGGTVWLFSQWANDVMRELIWII
ncbi:hypothetical protein DFA_08261 [Cavenderia fasciculata]|uniref:Uncharacterized protein n=1 Tax=Cavenderia fasciculata TaxID=261658 RepID=F4Q5L0_CACFS|nr:uncharacterized protein DFA_08261 [Cavenderia fasciculata]EGG17269.1 hypothetical protein DFA_08261 [Cavenderia fasciculata]|eukprot:XP_004355753.1 hypothetical protein DFA_08261 [Cavenderia fasciculata]